MITLPLVAGLIVIAAAAVALIVFDGRAVAAGLFLALLISPFATSPIPGALQLAARAVAALLAAYVLWMVMKGGSVRSEGSAIGPVAEIIVAGAAYALGWWIQPVTPLQAPLSEQATGFALVALAVLPLAGSNVLRAGVGVLLATLGASMVMEAWLGPMPALGQLALTALLLVIPGTISLLVDPDDAVARVVPAVEQVRPEQPLRAARVDPFGAVGAVGAAGSTGAAGAVGPAETPTGGRAGAVAPDSRPPASDQASEEPTTVVTGPRPSVRFLGRGGPIRHASEASQARRPEDRRLPGLGRRTEPKRPAAEPDRPDRPEKPDKPDKPAARPGIGAPHDSPTDMARIRDLRNPRDPRNKRPLR